MRLPILWLPILWLPVSDTIGRHPCGCCGIGRQRTAGPCVGWRQSRRGLRNGDNGCRTYLVRCSGRGHRIVWVTGSDVVLACNILTSDRCRRGSVRSRNRHRRRDHGFWRRPSERRWSVAVHRCTVDSLGWIIDRTRWVTRRRPVGLCNVGGVLHQITRGYRCIWICG